MKYLDYLYGAYGSNLNLNQMIRRCPNARPVGSVVVQGMQLAFRGVADVIHKKDGKVALGLWKITEACEAQLDIYKAVSAAGICSVSLHDALPIYTLFNFLCL